MRAGAEHLFDTGQFDCIDSSRNTTSLLLVLDQLKLLRYHDVDVPVARGFLIDGRYPHVTAVLVEKASGTKWAVDSWTVGYGQDLEIMPLERWKTKGTCLRQKRNARDFPRALSNQISERPD